MSQGFPFPGAITLFPEHLSPSRFVFHFWGQYKKYIALYLVFLKTQRKVIRDVDAPRWAWDPRALPVRQLRQACGRNAWATIDLHRNVVMKIHLTTAAPPGGLRDNSYPRTDEVKFYAKLLRRPVVIFVDGLGSRAKDPMAAPDFSDITLGALEDLDQTVIYIFCPDAYGFWGLPKGRTRVRQAQEAGGFSRKIRWEDQGHR